MMERNLLAGESQNIKPTLQSSYDCSLFKPNKYLNARKEHLEMINNHIPTQSIQVTRVLNLKKSNKESLDSIPMHGSLMQSTD